MWKRLLYLKENTFEQNFCTWKGKKFTLISSKAKLFFSKHLALLNKSYHFWTNLSLFEQRKLWNLEKLPKTEDKSSVENVLKRSKIILTCSQAQICSKEKICSKAKVSSKTNISSKTNLSAFERRKFAFEQRKLDISKNYLK